MQRSWQSSWTETCTTSLYCQKTRNQQGIPLTILPCHPSLPSTICFPCFFIQVPVLVWRLLETRSADILMYNIILCPFLCDCYWKLGPPVFQSFAKAISWPEANLFTTVYVENLLTVVHLYVSYISERTLTWIISKFVFLVLIRDWFWDMQSCTNVFKTFHFLYFVHDCLVLNRFTVFPDLYSRLSSYICQTSVWRARYVRADGVELVPHGLVASAREMTECSVLCQHPGFAFTSSLEPTSGPASSIACPACQNIFTSHSHNSWQRQDLSWSWQAHI